MAPTKKAAAKKTEPKKTEETPASKVVKKTGDRPKGAKNAYMLFALANREAILADSTEKNVMKAAAVAWKKLEDKSEWEEKAKEEKERYQQEMDDFKGGK